MRLNRILMGRISVGRISVGRFAAMMLAALALQPLQSWAEGDVVGYIEAKEINNPPPSVALETFDRFEIVPIAMVAPYAG